MRLTTLSSTSITTPPSGWLPSRLPKSDSGSGDGMEHERAKYRSKLNTEPTPTRLVTVISPPMACTIRWLMAKPSPVPPRRRERVLSTWWKGWKTCVSDSGAMPMPVSSTTKRTR